MQNETGLIVHEQFSNPEVNADALGKVKKKCHLRNETGKESAFANVDDQHLERGFACPETGCVKSFVSRKSLENHLDTGKHFYRVHKESAYDDIERKWASKYVTVGTVKGPTSHKSESLDIGNEKEKEFYRQGCERGWALKKPKATVRFTKSVKDFLNEIFLKSEETGQKLNPAEISSQLRNTRATDRNKMFQRSEWLTTQQITSYFSQPGVLQRSDRLEENEEEEDEEVAMIDKVLQGQRVAEELAISTEP